MAQEQNSILQLQQPPADVEKSNYGSKPAAKEKEKETKGGLIIPSAVSSEIASGGGTAQVQQEAVDEGKYESIQVKDQEISLEGLRAHVNTVHPRHEGAVFSLCATLGSYDETTFNCCPEELSELAREINIGPSMFLMSTK